MCAPLFRFCLGHIITMCTSSWFYLRQIRKVHALVGSISSPSTNSIKWAFAQLVWLCMLFATIRRVITLQRTYLHNSFWPKIGSNRHQTRSTSCWSQDLHLTPDFAGDASSTHAGVHERRDPIIQRQWSDAISKNGAELNVIYLTTHLTTT